MSDFEMDFVWPRRASYRFGDEHDWATFCATFDDDLDFHDPDKFEPNIVGSGLIAKHRPTQKELDFAVRALAIPEPKAFDKIVMSIVKVLGMPTGSYRAVNRWRPLAYTIQTILGADGLKTHNEAQLEFQEEHDDPEWRPINQGKYPWIAKMELIFVTAAGRAPYLAFRPGDLRDALVFHAARMASRGAELKPCEQCGTSFMTGGTRASGKKIASARFCSDQCRWDFNNARRKA